MAILTAQKDGRYITELYIGDGPKIAHLMTRADTVKGWAEIVWTFRGNHVYDENGAPLLDRVYGPVRYVDTRQRRR